MEDTASTGPGGGWAPVPRVSVVMPVYEDLRFLDAAVDSILNQDFRDLELVIVDDGNGRDDVFDGLARRDRRIRIVVNRTNIGLPAATNRGITAARADIIARLDADDIAEPTRIGRLVAALDADPELGLVGSWYVMIDESGLLHDVGQTPESDLEIRWRILFFNPFCHSAAAFRRNCFDAAGRYRSDQPVSCDHYLWADMLAHCRAHNLQDVLVRYRANSRGLIARNMQGWRARTNPIREKSWARLGVDYVAADDAVAQDLAEFLGGSEITRVEGRPLAYRTLLTLLRRFLDERRPFARAEDKRVARRLAAATVARILADRPVGLAAKIEICRLTWPLDRRATIAAFTQWLTSGLAFQWWAK